MTTSIRTPVSRVVLAICAYDDITQEDLAARLGIHQATISRKLAGKQAWSESDIAALATELADARTRMLATAARTLEPLPTAPYASAPGAGARTESHVA